MFFSETCEDEIWYYSFNTKDILEYDKHNRKLLYYQEITGFLLSGNLNLNAPMWTVVINKANVTDFAFDGERGVLYYLHKQTLKINSVNISSGEDTPVQALGSLSGIKGMELDIKNG